MRRDLRLFDPAFEPEPSEPIRPRLHVPRPEPHYSLVVLPRSIADDPDTVATYPKLWNPMIACEKLAKDPTLFERLKVAVKDPVEIAVIDSGNLKVWFRPVLGLVRKSKPRRSWWKNLIRRFLP